MSLESLKQAMVEKTRSFLLARQQAYRQTFNLESIYARRVLKDLARFCRAHETTFNQDARLHGVLEGRREVWLRIEKNLKLTPEEIWALYGRTDLE